MRIIFSDPAILGFITSVCFLTALFIYALYYILKRQSELQKKEREFEKKANRIIEKAEEHAEEIVKDAAKSAEAILTQSKTFKEGLEKDLKGTLNSEMNVYKDLLNEKLSSVLTNYQKVLTQTGSIYANSIKEANQELKLAQQKNAENFKSVIEDQSLTAKFYIQRKVNEELDKAKKEIDEYKEEEKKRIQSTVQNIILSLSENVFDGTLTIEQQEKLIFKALAEAKNKDIFTI